MQVDPRVQGVGFRSMVSRKWEHEHLTLNPKPYRGEIPSANHPKSVLQVFGA